MGINPINNVNNITQVKTNKNPNFGHTFRVSICTKDVDGVYSYVSPAKNTKLYKKLNKKVVSFLNEDFISNIRDIIGIPRKVVKKKTQLETKLQKDIVEKLSSIDSDYKQAPFVRSAYSKGTLGYIATGVDAPIIEEFMGADGIGVAKSMARKSGQPIWETDARNVVANFQKSTHEYVQSPTQLLRSKNDNEILLRVNFNEIKGKRGGKSKYEMAEFDFQELKTKQLPPLTEEDKALKKDIDLNWVAKRYIKHSFDKIYDKNKPQLTPQQILEVRNKFTGLISKNMDIKHDLPKN